MTFTHKFTTGESISITFDLSQTPVKATATPVPPGCVGEYKIWRDTVVAPQLLSAINRSQAMVFADMGRKSLGVSDADWKGVKEWAEGFENNRR